MFRDVLIEKEDELFLFKKIPSTVPVVAEALHGGRCHGDDAKLVCPGPGSRFDASCSKICRL